MKKKKTKVTAAQKARISGMAEEMAHAGFKKKGKKLAS